MHDVVQQCCWVKQQMCSIAAPQEQRFESSRAPSNSQKRQVSEGADA
jgi:hypothetical protein